MSSSPLHLLPDDKLDVLRYLDEFHYWHSLDDKRRCKRCSRVITGRQILVFELDGTRGKLRLQCPTVACISSPSDWAYADPFLAARLGAQPGANAREADAKITPAPRTNLVQPRLRRGRHLIPFRGALAKLSLLRPFAIRLHAIHPVA